ncbi:MAG: aspartyl/glutamyl-tRNA(Asn/Gln) amidotransferase subunit B [Planctomycetota bacterium]|nr:MAG: aspartyl/glutamyl-tRNA(Asn/Gln) amidotransferase subunit B [Planctomycetota bacterium]
MSAPASENAPVNWEPVIGLEVHVQLATQSKLFCRCPARFGQPPNTLICPVCTAQPGTLPVLNAEAVRLGIRAALALGCEIDTRLLFERKSYFAPDLPKGYQITQFERPLGSAGSLAVESEGIEAFAVSITRAHLEEDAGKVVHRQALSLIDLNRAGTPLLEIVSGPDLRTPEQAVAFLKTLRRLLRYVGVSDADMEKGSFRCDANVSLRALGSDVLGTRTETKNLNSFRFVAGALRAEIARQGALLDAGEPVAQETRGYDPDSGRTHLLRHKESAHDYRYAPEVDLPAYVVSVDDVQALRDALPELPAARRARFLHEGALSTRDADALTADPKLADYYERTVALTEQPRETAHWVLREALRLCHEGKRELAELATTPERLAELIRLVSAGRLSQQAGRRVVTALEAQPDLSAQELVEQLDLHQVSDAAELQHLVDEVIAAEASVAQRYTQGDASLLNALVGSAMQASGGKANPQRLRELFRARLEQRD